MLGVVFLLQYLDVAWTWYIGAAVSLNLSIVYGLYYLGWKKGAGLVVALFLTGYISLVNIQHKSGLEVLAEQDFADLKGKNVGVVVNHTSVDQYGNHLIQ